jgi:hypothetical protein
VSLSTAVGFLIFNRPDLTERVFRAIAEAKPRQLFVIADGPRSSEDIMKCEAARAIATRVHWDCEVRTNFSAVNLGCGLREATGFDWVFSQVDEAIFLEDDTLPAASFFSFCEKMLERYRFDNRIMHINGDNSANEDRSEDSYYFSKYVHGWGWASWRRAWAHYDYRMTRWPAFKKAGLMKLVCEDPYEQAYWEGIFEQMYADPKVIDTWDYQWIYAIWSQSGLAIAPNKNLISNIGFGRPDAAHTTADDPRSQLPVSDIWHVKHPSFLVRHRDADRHSFDIIFGGSEMRHEVGTDLTARSTAVASMNGV